MKKAILSFAILLFSTFIFGQITGEWEKLEMLQGGRVVNLSIKPSGTAYARVLGKTQYLIYKSTDDGENWTLFDHPFWSIKSNGTILYASSGFNQDSTSEVTKFRFSKDEGLTWTETQTNHSEFVQIEISKSGDWLASKGSYSDGFPIYRSRDEGATWEFLALAKASSSGSQELIELSEGVMIFFSPQFYNEGSISTDGGETWSNLDLNIGSWFDSFESYNFSEAPNGDFWFGGEEGLAKSVDRGITWEKILPDTLNQREASVVALNSGEILLSYEGSISNLYQRTSYLSRDDGKTWEPYDYLGRLHGQLVNNQTILKLEYTGIHRSSDIGKNWNYSDFGIDQMLPEQIFWSTKDAATAFAWRRFYQTADGGRTWEIINPAKNTTLCSEFKENRQLINKGSKFYLSNESGVTIKEVIPPPGLDYIGLYYAISPEGIIIFSTYSGTFLSKDEGVTWENQFISVPEDSVALRNFKFMSNGTWLAQGRKIVGINYLNLYRSSDLGQSWQIIPEAGSEQYFIDHQERIVFKKDRKMYLSENNGESFDSFGTAISSSYKLFQIDGRGSQLFSLSQINNRKPIFLSNNDGFSLFRFPMPVDSSTSDLEEVLFNKMFFSKGNFIYGRSDSNWYRFNRPTTDFADLTSTSDLVFSKNNIKIFPNPTQNQFTISLPEKSNTDFNLFIFNNLGQKVFEQRLPKNQIEHRIENFFLPEGVYYFLVKNKEGNIGNGKVIISKN